MSWYGWRPYVPVAARRARAQKKMEKLRKKGLDIRPLEIEGRKIARTFWGKAWCDHLELFSDFRNRLPRGRSYVRNGSVCHLDIAKGEINAMVSGSRLYTVKVAVKTLPRKKWKDVKNRCSGQIGSLLELLQGRLSSNVMSIVTDRDNGLFPLPGEIRLACSCPDWAVLCKHVAAVLYGVGARLDAHPELLFLLRGVNHEELIGAEVGVAVAVDGARGSGRRIGDDALADVFGIEMSEEVTPVVSKARTKAKARAKPVTESKTRAGAKAKPGAKTATKSKTRAKAKATPRAKLLTKAVAANKAKARAKTGTKSKTRAGAKKIRAQRTSAGAKRTSASAKKASAGAKRTSGAAD
jgi:uncharacterized Zn finger protein